MSCLMVATDLSQQINQCQNIITKNLPIKLLICNCVPYSSRVIC